MLESDVQKIADILAPLVKRRGSGDGTYLIRQKSSRNFFWVKMLDVTTKWADWNSFFHCIFPARKICTSHCKKQGILLSLNSWVKITWIQLFHQCHTLVLCYLISRNIPFSESEFWVFPHCIPITTPAACNLMHFLVISRNSQKG